MKNLWIIFISILAIFVLLFVIFRDWNFNTLPKSLTHEKIKVQRSINNKVPNYVDTTIAIPPLNTSYNTHNKSSLTKNATQANTEEKTLPNNQSYKEKIEKAFPDEAEVKPIQKFIVKTTTLSIDGATKVKMKIKAKELDGIVKTKVSITHDMITYKQAKKKSREANFIIHITALAAKRVVYNLYTSQFLSKNPLLKFSFKGKKGEKLTIIYQELKGKIFYASKKIK